MGAFCFVLKKPWKSMAKDILLPAYELGVYAGSRGWGGCLIFPLKNSSSRPLSYPEKERSVRNCIGTNKKPQGSLEGFLLLRTLNYRSNRIAVCLLGCFLSQVINRCLFLFYSL